ncbi:MAG TPA: hypothetical protein VHT30_06105, partial [Acidimicrobiales bacterium]|nr:hypothetical protein [Acidimicrobiales bacterium]
MSPDAAEAAPAPAAPSRGGKQQIPRPSGAQAGGLPPWASLPAPQRSGISVARVRRGFEQRGWLCTTPRALPPARLARYQEPVARPA